MTQPPNQFDPYNNPMQPVHYPQAGPQPMNYPGQMRGVDQQVTAVYRPGVVVAAFAVWLLAAVSWPLGTLVRLAVEEGFGGFGPIMTLFVTGCVAVAGVWGAVMFLNGSYYARLALCGGSMVIGILTLAAVIIAARDGATEPVSWVVIVARLVLPIIAAVLSFLPGTRNYFAGNLG